VDCNPFIQNTHMHIYIYRLFYMFTRKGTTWSFDSLGSRVAWNDRRWWSDDGESWRGVCHRQTGMSAVIEFVLARTCKTQWLDTNPTIEHEKNRCYVELRIRVVCSSTYAWKEQAFANDRSGVDLIASDTGTETNYTAIGGAAGTFCYFCTQQW